MKTKICTKCKVEKDIKEFYKDKSTKDKLYPSCKLCCHKKEKQYHINNKDQRIKRSTIWNNNHKEHRKKYGKKWRRNHPSYRNNYEKKRLSNDLFYKFISNIRCVLRKAFKRKGYSKTSHTYEILKIGYEDCLNYLFKNAKLRYPDFEHKDFLEKNKYHIDHIVPLATAKTKEDVIRLCQYSNLQLLTKEDNLVKHDKTNWNLKN